MNTFHVSGLARASVVLVLGGSVWMGCSKEQAVQPAQTGAGPETSQASPKTTQYHFFNHTNSTWPFFFTTWKGCNGCYGQCYQGEFIPDECPGLPLDVMSQTTMTVGVYGSCQSSTIECIFQKPATSLAKGITYYLVPNQGGSGFANRKKLQFRFLGPGIVPPPASGCGWFNYDVATNMWTAAPGASTYFVWAQVTTLPASCC